MKATDHSLREAYRRFLGGRGRKSRRGCPPPAEWVRFFSADAPRRLKVRLLDHLGACGFCAEEFGILLDVDRDVRAFAAATGRPARPAGRTADRRSDRGFLVPGRWLFVGAGLVAAMTVFLTFLPPTPDPVAGIDSLRSADFPEIVPEEPRGTVDGNSALVFRWREPRESAGAVWVVSVFDESLRRIWKSPPARGERLALSDEVGKGLVPGRTYFWSVGDPAGSVETGLEPFVISPVGKAEGGSDGEPGRKARPGR